MCAYSSSSIQERSSKTSNVPVASQNEVLGKESIRITASSSLLSFVRSELALGTSGDRNPAERMDCDLLLSKFKGPLDNSILEESQDSSWAPSWAWQGHFPSLFKHCLWKTSLQNVHLSTSSSCSMMHFCQTSIKTSLVRGCNYERNGFLFLINLSALLFICWAKKSIITSNWKSNSFFAKAVP